MAWVPDRIYTASVLNATCGAGEGHYIKDDVACNIKTNILRSHPCEDGNAACGG